MYNPALIYPFHNMLHKGRKIRHLLSCVMTNRLASVSLLPHSYFTLGDGDSLRYAVFSPSPDPRGTVLVVPGAREFIEKKYAECVKPLIERGYRVIVVELRGQGLSSRFLGGDLRQRNHIDDFSTYLNDLRAFYKGIVLPSLAGPLIAHGHSLGAHILLRWLAEDNPSEIKGAFVTAPMVSYSGMVAHMAFYGLTWANVRLLGEEKNYAPMQHDFGGEDVAFEDNQLTHDEARFRVMEEYFCAYPDLTTGGVTWGWMLAALQSMAATHAWPYLAHIKAPILSLTGNQDTITPPIEIGPFLNMIPHVRTYTIPGARHDLLNETDDICARAWARIDDFLGVTMGTERRSPKILYLHRVKRPEDLRAQERRILPTD